MSIPSRYFCLFTNANSKIMNMIADSLINYSSGKIRTNSNNHNVIEDYSWKHFKYFREKVKNCHIDTYASIAVKKMMEHEALSIVLPVINDEYRYILQNHSRNNRELEDNYKIQCAQDGSRELLRALGAKSVCSITGAPAMTIIYAYACLSIGLDPTATKIPAIFYKSELKKSGKFTRFFLFYYDYLNNN